MAKSRLFASLRCRRAQKLSRDIVALASRLVQFVGRGNLVERPKSQIHKTVRPGMTKKNGGMKLTILPLTPDMWPALEDLFGKWGDSNG